MDFLIELGAKIRHRRQELNISQQELAEAVGYTSKGMISSIEYVIFAQKLTQTCPQSLPSANFGGFCRLTTRNKKEPPLPKE